MRRLSIFLGLLMGILFLTLQGNENTTVNAQSCCDPEGSQELACINSGGTWDPVTCVCTPPCEPPVCDPGGCDPAERDACIAAGGEWDDITCTCTPCEEMEVTDYSTDTVSYCFQGIETTCTYTYENVAVYDCQGNLIDYRSTLISEECSSQQNGCDE